MDLMNSRALNISACISTQTGLITHNDEIIRNNCSANYTFDQLINNNIIFVQYFADKYLCVMLMI